MTVGILKSKSVFVNQIAGYLREPIPLKKTAKRLSAQYLKDFFFGQLNQCLKKNTSVTYKGESLPVKKMVKKIHFDTEQKVIKIKKNKKVARTYELAAVQASFKTKGKRTKLGW